MNKRREMLQGREREKKKVSKMTGTCKENKRNIKNGKNKE